MAQTLKPNRIDNRGGKRENAGRPAKPYPVKQMGMRVPEAVFDKCVEACKKITEEYEAQLKNNS